MAQRQRQKTKDPEGLRRTTLRLPPEMLRRAKFRALELDTTLQEVFTLALAAFLDAEKRAARHGAR